MSQQVKNDAWLAGFEVGYGDWGSLSQFIQQNTEEVHLLTLPEYQIGFEAGKAQLKVERLERVLKNASL